MISKEKKKQPKEKQQKDKQKRKGHYNFTGAKNNHAKLTEKQVVKMRKMFSNGFKLDFIAAFFKRPKNTIRNIVYGQTWRHLL